MLSIAQYAYFSDKRGSDISIYISAAECDFISEFWLKLADGLKADPLGTHLPGIRVLHRVYVNQALSLLARLLDGATDGINAASIDHLMPVLQRKAAYQFLVAGHRIAEQVLLPLMLVEPRQAAAYVADVVWSQFLLDEAHGQHQTVARTAGQVAERLLDAIIEFVTLSPWIVSCLADEVHCGGKGTIFPRDFWVLQIDF